jgi:hypothetical protein
VPEDCEEMGWKLIRFSPRAHGKEHRLKLVVPDPASVTLITCVKKNLWVQYLKHTIDLEAAHSIGSQERSDGIAVRPRCRFFYVWEDWTNVDPKHSPQRLIRRTPNLAAPCSNSNIPSSTPSCCLAASTQIVRTEVHCLRQRTYTLTLTR